MIKWCATLCQIYVLKMAIMFVNISEVVILLPQIKFLYKTKKCHYCMRMAFSTCQFMLIRWGMPASGKLTLFENI